MRFVHPSGEVVHAAYCTNVHGGETPDEILAQLDRFAVPIRRELGSDTLGLGLWVGARAARALAADPGELGRLRSALQARSLEVVTLNGFPYAGFQDAVVKHRVYHPDWSERARLDYTTDLVHVLAGLLPDDAVSGSISTLPLGWRHPWFGDRQSVVLEHLDRLAETLHAVADRGGRPIRVGLEPEPGCVVETTSQAVERLAGVDRDVIGVCLDLCHLAVQFEAPAAATARLSRAGLRVVKAQVSAALHAVDPHDPEARAALETFAEERFLHQVREQPGDAAVSTDHSGTARGWDDLGDALDASHRPASADGAGRPWRVHFHVPLDVAPEPPLRATVDELRDSLQVLVGSEQPLTTHLEVETYTWGVVPEHVRPRDDAELATRVAGELAWLRDHLVDLGLKEHP